MRKFVFSAAVAMMMAGPGLAMAQSATGDSSANGTSDTARAGSPAGKDKTPAGSGSSQTGQ